MVRHAVRARAVTARQGGRRGASVGGRGGLHRCGALRGAGGGARGGSRTPGPQADQHPAVPKGPRIIDFGIAWATGASTLTHVGTAVGSPGFLAPEQVRGAAVTPATDVFSLGATLAYAATADSPFGHGSSEVMLYRVVHEEPHLLWVHDALAPLVRACLAKDPEDRPSTLQLSMRLKEIAAREAQGRLETPAARAAPRGRGGPADRTTRLGPSHTEQHTQRHTEDAPTPRSQACPSVRRPAAPAPTDEPTAVRAPGAAAAATVSGPRPGPQPADAAAAAHRLRRGDADRVGWGSRRPRAVMRPAPVSSAGAAVSTA